jgi:hypothetical protein
MMSKQHFSWFVSLLMAACSHETAASGATDTQVPKMERAALAAAEVATPAVPGSQEAEQAACSSDSDCRPVDVYCGSCQCVALSNNMKAPECPGSEVQCFAQPCRGQQAVCKAGGCSLGGANEM